MSAQCGGTLRSDLALIDTSAVVALFDKHDTQHEKAKLFFAESPLAWAAVNLTAHETFTRLRYGAMWPSGSKALTFYARISQ